MLRLITIVTGLLLATGFVVLAPPPTCRAQQRRLVSKRCSGCNKEVPLSSKAGQHCPHCGVYWSTEKQRSASASGRSSSPAQKDPWMAKKPTRPGQVTVVLKSGSHFTGTLMQEDEKFIRIRMVGSGMGGAEMGWEKKKVEQVLRFGEPLFAETSAAPETKGPPDDTPPKKRLSHTRPGATTRSRTRTSSAMQPTDAGGGSGLCKVRIVEINKTADKANVTLRLDWQGDAGRIDAGDITPIFLFQPRFFAKLYPPLMKLRRSYIFNICSADMCRILSPLVCTDRQGDKHDVTLMIFSTSSKTSLDLRKSGQYTFPIPIQAGSSLDGQPSICGKGLLSVAVFKENDPKLDQLKSTDFVQLSNEVRQPVDLSKPGREVIKNEPPRSSAPPSVARKTPRRSTTSSGSIAAGPWEMSVLSFKTTRTFEAKGVTLQAKGGSVIALIRVRCKRVRGYTSTEENVIHSHAGWKSISSGRKLFENDMFLGSPLFALAYIYESGAGKKLMISMCRTMVCEEGLGRLSFTGSQEVFGFLRENEGEATLAFEYDPSIDKNPILMFTPILGGKSNYAARISTGYGGDISVEYGPLSAMRKYMPKELLKK